MTGTPVGRVAEVRLVAGATARELVRRRATWTTTLLTGVVVAVMVVGAAVVNDVMRERATAMTYRVLLDGDVAGARDFLASIDDEALAFAEGGDAQEVVARSEAAVGLRLPARLDDRIAAGESPEVTVFYRSRNDVSIVALQTLLLQVQHLQTARVDAAATAVGVEPRGHTAFVEREVSLDAAANRRSLGATLAAVAAVLCLGVITSAASAAGGGRDDRSIEGVLVLPLRRGSLAVGTVLGVVPVAVLQLLAAVGLIVVATALPVSGLNQSAADVVAMLVVAVPATALLGVLAVAVGCLAGVMGAGAEDAVSLGDLLAVPFVAVAAAFLLAPSAMSGPVAWLVPIVGPLTMLRDGIAGGLGAGQAVVVTVAALGWIAVTVALVRRGVAAERRVLRAT